MTSLDVVPLSNLKPKEIKFQTAGTERKITAIVNKSKTKYLIFRAQIKNRIIAMEIPSIDALEFVNINAKLIMNAIMNENIFTKGALYHMQTAIQKGMATIKTYPSRLLFG
jgi:hypothetical protein